MKHVYIINPPRNVKKTVPQAQETQKSQTNTFGYGAPIYLRVSRKTLQKLRQIDPTIKEDFDEFIVDPVSGLVFLPNKEKPLTHIENLRVLKAFILYSQHVRPFK